MSLAQSPLQMTARGLAWRSYGAADKPWMVLTHGSFMRHEDFASLLPPLSERFRLLLWDLPGHGQSQAPMPNRLEALAEAQQQVMDAAGIDRAWLLGHSLGGMVTQAFLLRQPERALGFVAYGCIALHQLKMPLPGLIAALVELRFKLMGSEKFVQEFSSQCSHSEAAQKAIAEVLRSRVQNLRKPIWQAMIHGTRLQTEYRFPCPVGHIRGALDNRFAGGEAGMDRLAALLPEALRIKVADVGHCAHLESPDAFNAALAGLLDRLGAPLSLTPDKA